MNNQDPKVTLYLLALCAGSEGPRVMQCQGMVLEEVVQVKYLHCLGG